MNSCAYYSSFLCIQICFNSCPFHKSCHKCFARSGPFLEIRSLLTVIGIHGLNMPFTRKSEKIIYKSSYR